MTFEFAWPLMICLLPFPLLVWLLSPAPRSGQSEAPEIYFPHLERLRAAFSIRRGEKRRTNALYHGLLALAWLFIVLALMQPEMTDRFTPVKNKGYDLMLVVDLSGSMAALDFSTKERRANRLDVVKEVVGRFAREREGDRVGLVLFGQHAYLQVPLTTDTRSVSTMLNNTVVGEAGDSTAIGDALGVAVKNLRDRPGKSKIIILLTDGADNASSIPPMQSAKLAKDYGIRVYTISVGSNGTVPFPLPTGQVVMTRMDMDEDLLQKIADTTGADYYRATNTEALARIYEEINQLEKTEANAREYLIRTPLYRWPLGAALALLLFLSLYPVYRRTSHAV